MSVDSGGYVVCQRTHFQGQCKILCSEISSKICIYLNGIAPEAEAQISQESQKLAFTTQQETPLTSISEDHQPIPVLAELDPV